MKNNRILQALSRLDTRINQLAFKLKMPRFNLHEDLGWIQTLLSVLYLGFWLVVIGYCLYWFLYFGPWPALTNSSLRLAVPTPLPTPTERSLETGLTSPKFQWLSNSESAALKARSNVVNIANLSGKRVYFASQSGVLFSAQAPWKRSRPLGFTEASVQGTGAQIKVNGITYQLNIYQPFLINADPTTLYVIDQTSQLWQSAVKDLQFEPLETIKQHLPLEIGPNPDLGDNF